MAKLVLYFLIFITIPVFGQSQSQILEGKILADSLQGYAINIVNYTKKIGVTNDEKGIFKIPVSIGDSIVFSSVQYDVHSINITQAHLEKKEITVILKPKVQLLEQVQVSNVQLSGNLYKDAGIVELQPFLDNQKMGLPYSKKPKPTLAERKLYTAKTSASGIPLDLMINIISGRLKTLKRNKALEDLNKIVQKGELTFNSTFFMDSLGLPKELVLDFIYYCAEDECFKSLLRSSKQLSLVEFFQKKAIAYKKHKKIEY